MKIALLTGLLSHNGFGVKNSVERLSKCLERHGHEVVVFGEIDDAWESGDHSRWCGSEHITYSALDSLNFGLNFSLYSRLLQFDPDVVHVNGLWKHNSVVARNWSRRTSKPVVVSPRGMLSSDALSFSRWKKVFAMNLFQLRCLRHASCIHVTSDDETVSLRKLGVTTKCKKIPNGIDSSTAKPVPFSERQNVVLAMGRIHPIKGYDNLILAWGKIERDFPAWSLIIRGPDHNLHRSYLVDLANRLNLDSVTIGGEVCDREKDEFLSHGKLFVLSSLSENFGLTVGEALSNGTPVVASKGSPWKGLISRQCGWWTDSDVESLAANLALALNSPEVNLELMGQKGADWIASDFSWGSVAESFLELYQTLIQPEELLTAI